MSLNPVGESRVIGGAEVQYVQDKSHAHEGGHQIILDGQTLLVLPDGRTTGRKRSHAVTAALQAIGDGTSSPVHALIGALVVAGVTNLHLDDRQVLSDRPEMVLASIRLEAVFGPTGVEFRAVTQGGIG